MKGKIELEYPFNERWKSGYVVINNENRRHICLVNSHEDRTTISYARYLMSVHLGRILNPEEHVDHKDEDKTNDVISNLQIMTVSENNKKHAKSKGGRQMVEYECPICQTHFSIRKGNSHLVESKKYTLKVCSDKCKFTSSSTLYHLTKEQRFKKNESSFVRLFKIVE
ncbi:putative homing endonuclease [Aeromonas phage P19]|nr:putative homing endonuclease [Aeromonas phage P19]